MRRPIRRMLSLVLVVLGCAAAFPWWTPQVAAEPAEKTARKVVSLPRSVGPVQLRIKSVASENGTYSIEMVISAEGKDVVASADARYSSVITPSDGATVSASYVRIGGSSGIYARATLVAGYELPVTVQWSLKDPNLEKLTRVNLSLQFDGKDYYVNYGELDIQ